MADLADRLVQYSQRAIESAAEELGMDPLALARRLNQAEIARLVHLLNAAFPHVEHPALRHRIEDLLMAVTDGRMPSADPESELDWALKVAGRRRIQKEKGEATDAAEDSPGPGPDESPSR